MVQMTEMATSSNSFRGARVDFGGARRGVDEEFHYLLKVERIEGPTLAG